MSDPMAPTCKPTYPNDIPPEQIEDLIASTTGLQNQVLRKFARAVLEEMRYHLWAAQEKCKMFEQDAARWREIESRMVHQHSGPNVGWTLDELLPGDSPTDAVDAAMQKARKG